jgi:hypothetical protein
VAVEAKQVERIAEALGKEIAEDERHHCDPCDTVPLPPRTSPLMSGLSPNTAALSVRDNHLPGSIQTCEPAVSGFPHPL